MQDIKEYVWYKSLPMHSTWRDTGYGGVWTMHPTFMVKRLLIVHSVIFCLQVVCEWLKLPIFSWLMLNPVQIAHGYLWQFFSYLFLHANVLHLLFNMLMLYFLGIEVESEIGSKRFLQLYISGGLVGGFLWYLFNIHSHIPMIGASGAVYSVVIAFGTLYPNRPITLLIFFVLPMTLLAKYLAIGIVAISIIFSLSGSSDIAHLAHLGGALFGYVFIKSLQSNRRWFFSFPWQKRKNQKAQSPTILRVLKSPTDKDEFIRQQIDPILDKIARQGIQSLTKDERQLLDEAKDRLS